MAVHQPINYIYSTDQTPFSGFGMIWPHKKHWSKLRFPDPRDFTWVTGPVGSTARALRLFLISTTRSRGPRAGQCTYFVIFVQVLRPHANKVRCVLNKAPSRRCWDHKTDSVRVGRGFGRLRKIGKTLQVSLCTKTDEMT